MRFTSCAVLALQAVGFAAATPLANPAAELKAESAPLQKREARHLRFDHEKRAESGQGGDGQPIWAPNRGAPISGGTNKQIDIENPSNLGQQTSDGGTVPNLKWRFSDSKSRSIPGGWTRTSVITDLPSSKDIAGAQQHLVKGAYRELHWHRVAEWGYVYKGEVLVTATDEDGKTEATKIGVGDIWYFPKGVAHGVQGLADQNEYLLIFDEGNFEQTGVTFNLPDWLIRTPKDVIAKNFGVNASVFDNIPKTDPYMVKGTVRPNDTTTAPYGKTEYIYFGSKVPAKQVPGGYGSIQIVDSRNFPIAKTIASALVTVKPGGIRELHWHPNAEEWLYFLQGEARASVYIGNSNARTFDFQAGDTAVFPDNSGHYVENTSKNETLVWLELYKSDRAVDISLSQWLALTPPNHVAEILNVSLSFVQNLKKEKQLIVGPDTFKK